MKYLIPSCMIKSRGRAPRGARGLKYPNGLCYLHTEPSRPSRGAWIEIRSMAISSALWLVAPRMGRVD